ncbi:integration host factor subunit alpha [Agrobacterium rhizogenes]|nr:integration host factor subunit alpha [Rhizobium rhizogenes]NTH99934.1 integration host factor subunit alpha [Rhizobium rhizogenes]NTJ18226.1 integration host factor subunit alpha [Rhizobium rhizogenes]
MTIKTLTRADITHSIIRQIGLSRTESTELVDTILEEICSALIRGENVGLSSFAAFNIREKSGRPGRNPKTGEDYQIAARRVISFTASDAVKTQIQKAHVRRKMKANARPIDPTSGLT